MNENEGFIRLMNEEVRGNLLEILSGVMLEGKRFVLVKGEEEVAAIIPIREFERLEYLKEEIKPSPFLPSEYEYYEDEKGIHCIRLNEFKAEFEEILLEVMLNGEVFGLIPPKDLAKGEFDTFSPAAIVMSINNFWLPDYWISEKNRLSFSLHSQ
ncbi:type II toxin-antitoxin system Phd/YefM family antitoxin [Cylindrospermum sp. FACHB-282]|uniref:type II toxin-antitoxin system Phd/YefM family antitoxin n=1 Tax=Cylindrospermum sp. FACHB-282 TaxID=2692794 RepID=UPI00168762D4|nr:type II toxin-antitoxin system Phd/YefM family antitoxin [Cylindrospermum sp. FACHB-282]MBD2385694.1 type II toxin-antitoxin system Phd/YefM family antitoxin [Cylindrospermum sp. FACHB-282]